MSRNCCDSTAATNRLLIGNKCKKQFQKTHMISLPYKFLDLLTNKDMQKCPYTNPFLQIIKYGRVNQSNPSFENRFTRKVVTMVYFHYYLCRCVGMEV